MYTVILKKNEEKKILNGFPWIYANEVSKIEGKDKQGSVAKVVSFDRRFVAQGYINHISKIIVRILSLREEEIDRDFFYKRIKSANEQRLSLGYENNYRVVFGESDFLPALIVDKYGDYLSVQFLSLGMDIRKDMIVDILLDIFNPKGIYERSDAPVRLKEGLHLKKGWLFGEGDSVVEIRENDLRILVDLENGQKTGYFLDQKENRNALKSFVSGKSVLDCFCNVGGFSLCALKYGAKSVTSVDISETALSFVRKNAQLNGFNIDTVCADVFEYLRELRSEKKKFGVVILDPPAFTKSANTVKEACKGYKDINISGLKLVENGGFLVTCSCSQHLSVQNFLNVIEESVFQSGRSCKLVEFRTQGKDHATLIGADAGLYLKVAILRVFDK